MYRILQIEDLPSDAYLVRREVKKVLDPSSFLVVDDQEHFQDALRDFKPHLIISDFSLPGFSWETALQITRAEAPGLPFIIVTGSDSGEIRANCLKAGASAFINKNSLAGLGPAIRAVLL